MYVQAPFLAHKKPTIIAFQHLYLNTVLKCRQKESQVMCNIVGMFIVNDSSTGSFKIRIM